MNLPSQQRGLGLFGWIFVLGAVGGMGLLTLRLIPFFINEMAIQKVVSGTANDPSNSNLDATQLRWSLQKRWDVEGIETLTTKDVKIIKTSTGRALTYDYEARTGLFRNIFIVVHFTNEFPIRGGSGSAE